MASLADSFHIKLASLNVRGIGDSKKRCNIFDWLHKQQYDVVFLQETHCIKTVEKRWSTEWGNMAYFCNGTSASAGVAILFSKHLNVQIQNVLSDNEGRILILDTIIDGNSFKFINVYAPTRDHKDEQNIFITELKKLLIDINPDNVVMGGDFNTILNPKLDKKGGIDQPRKNTYTSEILGMADTFNLVDVWRIHNPETLRFTWRQRKPLIQCRLDFWLISDHLCNVVRDTKIMPAIRTDHSLIYLELSSSKDNTRGPGFWKHNNSLLHDNNYVAGIKECITDAKAKYQHVANSGLKWDLIKMEIRSKSIHLSKLKRKLNHEYELQLMKTVEELERNLNDSTDSDMAHEYFVTKAELDQLNEIKTKGTILRSKALWAEQGEKCSKYFLGLERCNYKNKHIVHLKTQNGSDLYTQNDILKEFELYYKHLYTSDKNVNRSSGELQFLINDNIPQLNEDQRKACEADLCEEELLMALKCMKNGKTPGSDGLSVDFYKFFWCDIKDLLLDSFIYAFIDEKLSIDQRRALISLIPKADKIRFLLANWRPISLLNTDYKILAKVLAMRLENLLPFLIDEDQTAYIKKRFIGDNIRLISDVLEYTRTFKSPGYIILIDFEKAFDTLEWSFLYKALNAYNFGNNFIKWVKILYADISSCVLNNGFSTNTIYPSRGIRQGCPISAMLFILAAELLAIKIRGETAIKGIQIFNVTCCITQVADDTTCFVTDTDSIKALLSLLQRFKLCSGLAVNYRKTKVIPIGNAELPDTNKLGISCETGNFKTLGIHFCLSEKDSYALNFAPKIQSMKNILNMWQQRDLSIKGKITVLKALVIAKIQYVTNMLPVPEDVIKDINQCLFAFVWNKKPHKIASNVLIAPIKCGGLKMPDFDSMIKAAKLAWIPRIMKSNSRWNQIFQNAIQPLTRNFLFQCKYSTNSLNVKLPAFYEQIICIFQDMRSKDPHVEDNALWFNKNITIDNKILFYPEWFQKGIWKIGDLCDNNGNFGSSQYILDKFNITTHFLQTLQLRHALPHLWKLELCTAFDSTRYEIRSRVPSLTLGNVNVPMSTLETNQIYWHLVHMKIKEPTCLSKWNEIYDHDPADWEEFFYLPYSVTRETKLQTFQYKILHRIFPCRYWLHICKVVNNDKCLICTETDSISHYFIDCVPNQTFWQCLTRWVSRALDINLLLKKQDILFGIPKSRATNISITHKHVINYCLLLAKWYIYINKESHLQLYGFLVLLKQKLSTEKIILLKLGQVRKYERIWKHLLEFIG